MFLYQKVHIVSPESYDCFEVTSFENIDKSTPRGCLSQTSLQFIFANFTVDLHVDEEGVSLLCIYMLTCVCTCMYT